MKWKGLAALGLSAAMSVSLLSVSAGAVSFTDVSEHWAKPYIENMVEEGLVKGYEDNTYRPDKVLSLAEGLAFCARSVQLPEEISKAMLEKQQDYLEEMLEGEYSYFYTEFAVCLETGILTRAEFKALVQGGHLKQDNAMPKQDLARYLVRAMGLNELAESQTSYPLGFQDVAEIEEGNLPSVYLLNMYGIVNGDEKNIFNADVNRAIMATMLSRVLELKEERGISVELPAYSEYDWVSGKVKALNTSDLGVTVLTLDNEFAEEPIVMALPDAADIYENNMLAGKTALKENAFVRANLNEKGEIDEIRVYGELDRVEGEIATLTQDNLLLTLGGIPKTVAMDRFTLVRASGKVGTMDTVDLGSGYTEATALVDQRGVAVMVELRGGSTKYSGLFDSQSAAQSGSDMVLDVIGYDGVVNTYVMPADVPVTLNGVPLKNTAMNNYKGKFLTVRISDETGLVTSANFETASTYIQGSLRSFTWQSSNPSIAITDLSTGKYTAYTVDKEMKISYNGEAIEMKALENGWFVTARLSGNIVTELLCYPGSSTVEGVLTEIDYSAIPMVVLTVVNEDGTLTYTFELDITDLPEIKRDGKTSSVDKLKPGDGMVVTVRYNDVSRLDVTSQTANLSGVIQSISQTLTGDAMTVKLTDGTEVTYGITNSVSITQDGKAVSFSTLKAGYKVSLLADGDKLSSVEVTEATTVANEMRGSVVYVNTEEKTILFRDVNGDGTPISVDVSGAKYMGTDGSTLRLTNLNTGDNLVIYGSYNGLIFHADLVLR